MESVASTEKKKSELAESVRSRTEDKPAVSAADRFKGYKGISSDQYFGRDQVGVRRESDWVVQRGGGTREAEAVCGSAQHQQCPVLRKRQDERACAFRTVGRVIACVGRLFAWAERGQCVEELFEKVIDLLVFVGAFSWFAFTGNEQD